MTIEKKVFTTWTDEAKFEVISYTGGVSVERFKNEKRLLGAGNYGTVMKVQDEKWGEVAVKFFSGLKFEQLKKMEKENLNTLRGLSHPNIITFYVDVFDEKGMKGYVMEYMSKNLLRVILRDGGVKPDESVLWATHAALGLQYLHEQGFVHKDICPSKMFINGEGILKLGNCGYPEITDVSLTTNPWMVRYMAPEVYIDYPYKFSKASDIYGLGMTCWTLFTNQIPFKTSKSMFVLMNKVKKGDRPSIAEVDNLQIRNLIEKCWNADIHERPSAESFVTKMKEHHQTTDVKQTQQHQTTTGKEQTRDIHDEDISICSIVTEMIDEMDVTDSDFSDFEIIE